MARIEAPDPSYNGRIADVVFEDGVADTDNQAVIQYCQGAGYKVSGKTLNPIEQVEVPDPREVGEQVSGTRLRDAAVDPREGDFLPPTNAGQANPHGPEVVAPGIHAVSGPGAIVPGPVGKLEVVEDADGVHRVEVKSDPRGQEKRETEAAQRVFVDQQPVPEATATLAEANPQQPGEQPQPGDGEVQAPAGNASAEDWRAYVIEHRGADPEQVAGMKRDELREQYGPTAE